MISNEKAIYLLENAAWLGTNEEREEIEQAVEIAVNALKTTSVKDKDLISRQAAIEQAKELFTLGDCYCDQPAIIGMLNALPSAEPERKVGHWKKLSGFATPGGDPVWCCSECGKGVHVYGVEYNSYSRDVSTHQWASCPNCGVLMNGEQRD